MTSSLVGSEMCIRDRAMTPLACCPRMSSHLLPAVVSGQAVGSWVAVQTCLLYTSDAADDM
eukprot:5719699-Prorocentrum_lima.AAC.1